MTLSEKIILAAVKKLPDGELSLGNLNRSLSAKSPAGMPSKTMLLKAYHKLLKQKSVARNLPLEKLLTRRAVRSLSGVAIVTSLVKPYPCPGECVYCPLDERMPKSYLSDEPAAARALNLKFSPYEQMSKRIEALENNGHPADKIELIIKGGTWNSYALAYQYWFVLESFRAANELASAIRNSQRITHNAKRSKGYALYATHSTILTERSPLADLKKELFRQQKLNERAAHRMIGLTLETRPDCVTPKTVWQMREMGTTRIELGIQHTGDSILNLTKRGHSSERAKEATQLLRDYGFKVDFHLMPQLPGATPKADLRMMREIFSDPAYRPDMIKIYPCTVVKGSELYDWFKAGKYHAYPTRALIDILKKFKTEVPYYCRISRLIRDIPGQYIEEGNKVTNLRQVIESEMKRDGLKCRCLRCREVGHASLEIKKLGNKEMTPKLFVDKYETRGGDEFFLSFEDKKRQVVFAFCRLRVIANPHPTLSALTERVRRHPSAAAEGPGEDSPAIYPAFIRELHTYGQLISIGKRKSGSSQHTGLGKKLMIEAERIAKKSGAKKIAVISGVGVRDYYRHLGYRLEKTYMVKNF